MTTRITSIKTAINSTCNRASTIWEFSSCLLGRFVESVGSAISCWFSTSTYSRMISTCWVTFTSMLPITCECPNIHCRIHSVYISKIARSSLNRSFSIMINIDSGIHILIISISINRHTIFMLLMQRIASTPISSLFSKLCLGNCLRDLIIIPSSTTTTIRLSWRIHAGNQISVILSLIEELLSCHHHLLLLILTAIRSFPLIYQIEKVGLVVLRYAIGSPNTVISNTAWVNTKWTCAISITCISNALMVDVLKVLRMVLLSVEIVHCLLACIALPNVFHEISIIHGVSHLSVVVVGTFVGRLWTSKTSNSCLIEHLFLVHLAIYMREHFMNSRIIGWLKHYTMMSSIHFIDAQWSITSSVASSLFPHPVCHEESLVWFLCSQPKVYKIKIIYIN